MATLGNSMNIENTPVGTREITPVTGGYVKGTKINGKVLPVGAD